MGGRKITAKSIKRKNAPTHPRSRRALQLDRVALREKKLADAKTQRNRGVTAKTERLVNIIMLLPEETTHLATLPALHDYLTSSFLARHDDELSQEQSQRRPGRPPSKRETELKLMKETERREYMENMEVPDLLNETNVRLLREWDGDAQAMGLFRMVRISGTNKDQYVQTQKGQHKDLELHDKYVAEGKEVKEIAEMDR